MSWRFPRTAPLAVLLAAFVWGCDGDQPDVVAPIDGDYGPAFAAAVGGPGPTGAIFTTTPDGGVVNENVRYEAKIEVYLDGGPGANAPQTAAGLDDGLYVFQVTNPSGWVLLSMDPAKCRVVEVADGVIDRLVPPSELGYADTYTVGKGGNAETFPCHVQDDPDGVAGPSGRHDTNIDYEGGTEARGIVVQLMPFLDTPNPGGVYKAWVTPLVTYESRGGDLEEIPSKEVKKKGVFQGYQNDPGFGPPRSVQKTDNFKVKEVPPRIKVFKYEDLNGNGVKDPGEPEITGWTVCISETLWDDTEVTNCFPTPVDRAVAPGATVTVTELFPNDMWELSYVIKDELYVEPPTVSVEVEFAPGDLEHTVVFGNWKYAEKNGYKFHDLNANGMWNKPGEPALAGWTIKLDGYDGKGNAVNLTDVTDANGFYKFLVPPGTYDVSEDCSDKSGWYQSAPTAAGYACGAGAYEDLTFQSGDVDANNDFGNFKPVLVMVHKFKDLNGDGIRDANEEWLKDVKFCLYDGDDNLVSDDDFVGSAQNACQLTDGDGEITWDDLLPGTYTVKETLPDGFFATKTKVYIPFGTFQFEVTGAAATMITVTLTSGQDAHLFVGNVFNCVGLTPGYWKNWDNHYTPAQFEILLAGTIAGSIAEANGIFAEYDASDPQDLTILKAFTLANQLTLNLTQNPALPNPSGGSLFPFCTLRDYPAAPTLGEVLVEAVYVILGRPASDEYILQLKNWLDKYANQKWVYGG
jgi:hypothetical protein